MSDSDRTTPPKPENAAQDDLDDRTLIMPLPGQDDAPAQGEDVDEDRTILAFDPPKTAPESQTESQDPDRTIIAPMPVSATPEGEAEIEAEADGQQLEEEGSTYRPFSDVVPQEEREATEAEDATILAMGALDTSEVSDETASLEEPTALASTVAPIATSAPMPMRTLEQGSVINNMYRVEERLDQGGMGRVFRGTEIGTGESVAIKIILPEMAEDLRVAQMFRREARTLRQLHHDAIVRYFAYVPPDEFMDMHALVMGFIEGKKLSDKLKAEGPMVKDDVCQLFIRLADGLAQAHKIGVVHRDLSPDNVMLPENDINKAVLIDFGISRSSKIKDVTIGNEFAGKLKYVSPEQLGAYGGEADAPSDVYSFGLLMCACLMGKALPMGDSIVEAVQKRQGVPDLTEVPPSFQGLLYEMLQPDPAQRMQTMESVIDGLKSISGDGDMDRSFGPVTVAPSRTVPGLQAAPSAQQTTFMTSPPPLAEGQADAALAPAKGSVGLIAVLAVCACVAAGAGYYYFANAGSGDVAGTQEADDPLARVPDTLETYLAESVESECAFATLRAQGALAGRLTAISNGPQIGGSLVGNWPTAFGAAPDVAQFEVSDAQCAAVEFAHMFQGTRGASIEISVDQATVTRAEGVVGKITGSAERQNWLGLVAPNGRVFSLMSQLQAAIGTQRQFAFRLPSAQPGTYVLIATASDDALVRAGAMQDGTAAADIFPLMARELGADGNGALSISVLEITP